MMEEDEEFPEVVVHPIGDSIDLHTFQPQEVASIVQEYLRECHQRGFREVRIIHGKGMGVLREIVHSELRRSPYVVSFGQAPLESGGWGATLVVLRENT
jgi:DNA-nicking Smr family endonuclease